MLYAKNATVYLAARSEEKTAAAMTSIRAAVPKTSNGQLIYLPLDLSDLNSVKKAAETFLSREKTLHVLINNAGVGFPEAGSKTAQGYELQLGVNCVGPFLFTKLLSPTLVSTAKTSPPNTVRVVWTSSSAIEATNTIGFVEKLDYKVDKSIMHKYSTSKIGNYLHAAEYAERYRADGVISISLNPGNLDTDLWRTQRPLVAYLMRKTILYPGVYGAYTTIFAGFSPSITTENSGTFSESSNIYVIHPNTDIHHSCSMG
jgi:retinol dehydrogenase 12